MKIIIDNRTDLPMSDVLSYVGYVIRAGRISEGGRYCYCTTWTNKIVVYATKNKKSDTFIVSTYKQENLDDGA